MKRKGFYLPLCLLAAVTLCLLLMMRQQYPDTLSRLLTGRSQSAPAAVTVTSWPNSHENNFTIDDPTVLEQLWALMDDVPLVEQNITPCYYPLKGRYRFSLDGGREVLTDGVYLYTPERTYTAQTLPALLSALYQADEKAQFYSAAQSPLPSCKDPVQRESSFYAEMEAFGLDAPGKFYAVAQGEDGLWWCCTALQRYPSNQELLASRGVLLPDQLGSFRLTQIPCVTLSVNDSPWFDGCLVELEGNFEPGQIYDWSDRLTLDSFSANYVGPAENPEHHKPTCPGLYVSFGHLPLQSQLPEPPSGYTEEPPFDGGDLCPELTGWQVNKAYTYAMGDQFEKGWLFTAPGGGLSAQFVTLYEVSDPANIDWYHQAADRDMTRAELAQEGQWLLLLPDVADSVK